MNTEKIAYNVEEACVALGIGRSHLYKLARADKLELRKLGKRTLVTAASLHSLIENAEVA